MCSCGGLLTGWCFECGDDICPHCGCLTDHEPDGPESPSSSCRAGCPTRDHASWGDCVRAANIAIDREALRP